MTIEITIFHLVLSILLFFLMGIIFSKFEIKGYIRISSFNSPQDNSNGLLNLSLRTLSPIIYLVLVNYLLNFISPRFSFVTMNIWLIVPYYFCVRFIWILFMNRFFIFDKLYFFVVSILSSSISFFIYKEYLSKGDLFLPNKQEFLMQFWFVIIIFIYHFINNTQFKITKTRKETREDKFIKRRLSKFKLKYSDIVNKEKNNVIINLIYSIMIIEDFNRPYLIRLFEKRCPFAKTVGIMQTARNKGVSDESSVRNAIKIIRKAFNDQIEYYNSENGKIEKWKYKKGVNEHYFIRHAILAYNKCDNYYDMVLSVYNNITSR